MKHRSWPLYGLAFGALLLLVVLSGLAIDRYTQQIYSELLSTQNSYRNTERVLYELRLQMYSTAVLVRDYLLDPSASFAGEQKKSLLEVRSAMEREMRELGTLIRPADAQATERLRQNYDRYWGLIEPALDWTPSERAAERYQFLRTQLRPFRDSFLSIASEIAALNTSNLRAQQQRLQETQREFQKYLRAILATAALLGVLIAGITISRIAFLERRNERHQRQTERDREEMRSLSQRLVKAQEEERKSISRELHDEVGQMLTALRMEIGSLGELRDANAEEFQVHWKEAKGLAEQVMRTVRDMAMGLRPSMLDDLGLGPALEWQAREFARRSGITVDVEIDGTLEELPESHRTCVYRVVQEALTNCARHAQPGRIRITLHGRAESVSLTVQDDGVGFTPGPASRRGLGLIGIEERVRELGGEVAVVSQPGRGTLLRVEIPTAREVPA